MIQNCSKESNLAHSGIQTNACQGVVLLLSTNGFESRLIEERKRLGLGQDEFAELGGVKKLAQFNYEKGKRRPDVDYLLGIAAAGVDIVYLLTGQHTESDLSDEESLLISAYRRAPVAVRATVLAGLLAGSQPGGPTNFHAAVGAVIQGGENSIDNINVGTDPQKKK